MVLFLALILLTRILLVTCISSLSHNIYKLRLAKDTYLSEAYETTEIPVRNVSQPIHVYVGLAIRSILKVDMHQQTVRVGIWVRAYWTDELLQWDPTAYGDVHYQTMSNDMIWMPDIQLFNYGGGRFESSTKEIKLMVNHHGYVTCMYPALVEILCKLDVVHFPFDLHICSIQLASMTYDITRLNLTLKEGNPADLEAFQGHDDWEVSNFTAHEYHHHVDHSELQSGRDVVFSVNIYELTLRRFGPITAFYIIIPMFVMHAIYIMQFILPCDSKEKVSIGFTVSLSIGLFLMLVNEIFPGTDELPMVVEFTLETLAIQTLATAMTIFVLIFYHSGYNDNSSTLPHWARVVFLHWLAYILCMRNRITPDDIHHRRLHPVESEDSLLGLRGVSFKVPNIPRPQSEEHSSEKEAEKRAVTEKVAENVAKQLDDEDHDEHGGHSVADPTGQCFGAPASLNIRQVETLIQQLRQRLDQTNNQQGVFKVISSVNEKSEAQIPDISVCRYCEFPCRPVFMGQCDTSDICECDVQGRLQKKQHDYLACCCRCLQEVIAAEGWTAALVPIMDSQANEDTGHDNEDTDQDNQANKDMGQDNQDNKDTYQDNKDTDQDNKDTDQDNKDTGQDSQDNKDTDQDIQTIGLANETKAFVPVKETTGQAMEVVGQCNECLSPVEEIAEAADGIEEMAETPDFIEETAEMPDFIKETTETPDFIEQMAGMSDFIKVTSEMSDVSITPEDNYLLLEKTQCIMTACREHFVAQTVQHAGCREWHELALVINRLMLLFCLGGTTFITMRLVFHMTFMA